MFTFVISLVVVGVALAIATRVALQSEPPDTKPATTDDETVSSPAPEPAEPGRERVGEGGDDVATWLAPTPQRRVRSAVLLVTLLTALGLAVAVVLIVAGAILLSGLRTAVQ